MDLRIHLNTEVSQRFSAFETASPRTQVKVLVHYMLHCPMELFLATFALPCCDEGLSPLTGRLCGVGFCGLELGPCGNG